MSRWAIYREILRTPWGIISGASVILSGLQAAGAVPESSQLAHYWPPAWVWAVISMVAIMEGAYRFIRKRTAASLPEARLGKLPPAALTMIDSDKNEMINSDIQGGVVMDKSQGNVFKNPKIKK